MRSYSISVLPFTAEPVPYWNRVSVLNPPQGEGQTGREGQTGQEERFPSQKATVEDQGYRSFWVEVSFSMQIQLDGSSIDPSLPVLLQMVIAGAYYPHYFVQGEMDEAMAAKDLCGHDPRTTVVVRHLGMNNT